MVFWVRVAMVVQAKLSLLFGRSWRRGVLFCVVVVAKGRDNENPGGRNLMNIVPGKTNHPFIPSALTGCGRGIDEWWSFRGERDCVWPVACGLCPVGGGVLDMCRGRGNLQDRGAARDLILNHPGLARGAFCVTIPEHDDLDVRCTCTPYILEYIAIKRLVLTIRKPFLPSLIPETFQARRAPKSPN